MSVILFYIVLIGGLALVAALYLAALLLPIGLIWHRFGWIAGAVFAAVMAIVLWAFFEPPFNGVRLDFVPLGMRPNLYLVGLVQEPPVAMIVVSLVVAACGFAIVAIGRFAGRRDAG